MYLAAFALAKCSGPHDKKSLLSLLGILLGAFVSRSLASCVLPLLRFFKCRALLCMLGVCGWPVAGDCCSARRCLARARSEALRSHIESAALTNTRLFLSTASLASCCYFSQCSLHCFAALLCRPYILRAHRSFFACIPQRYSFAACVRFVSLFSQPYDVYCSALTVGTHSMDTLVFAMPVFLFHPAQAVRTEGLRVVQAIANAAPDSALPLLPVLVHLVVRCPPSV